MIADWPGLATSALYEGRDLRPTLGLDALIATVAAETFGLDRERVGRALFPRLQAGHAQARRILKRTRGVRPFLLCGERGAQECLAFT